jgi:hypothetical protein
MSSLQRRTFNADNTLQSFMPRFWLFFFLQDRFSFLARQKSTAPAIDIRPDQGKLVARWVTVPSWVMARSEFISGDSAAHGLQKGEGRCRARHERWEYSYFDKDQPLKAQPEGRRRLRAVDGYEMLKSWLLPRLVPPAETHPAYVDALVFSTRHHGEGKEGAASPKMDGDWDPMSIAANSAGCDCRPRIS